MNEESPPPIYSYGELFTEAVVRRWYEEWYCQGKTMAWIGGNNGLATTNGTTVKKYFTKFGLATQARPAVQETALAPVAAEAAPVVREATTVQMPVTALTELVRALERIERVTMTGSARIELNVEIEF